MSTPNPADRITLYYREGSSDKVYQAAIEPKDGGFVVNFAFGRRGSTLQTGTKTAKCVDYPSARKIYDKLVNQKTGKGYTPGQDGTPYQDTPQEQRATGVLPQLLNPIDEAEADKLLAGPDWWAQEKLDGKRILIRRQGREIAGINRKGLIVALPKPVIEQAMRLDCQQWLVDGEAIGDTFIAFDLLENAGNDLRSREYSTRLKSLYEMVRPNGKGALRALGTAMDAKHKTKLLAELRRRKAEGIVFKRHDAPYTAGRPASGGAQRKCKFYATASCIVAGVNKGKRSVAIELCDGAKRVPVGNVTIPAGKALPSAGEVIETRYLYAYPGGSLFQPVFLGRREDLTAGECKLSQLKFRAGTEEDEG